jgi:hypothetical protein
MEGEVMSCSRHAGCESHPVGAVTGCTACDVVCSTVHNIYVTPMASAENAFGKPVPIVRQVNALDTAVETLGVDAMLADPVIRVAARYIDLDEPERALTALQNIVDLTGAYRLLAVLCTEDGSER